MRAGRAPNAKSTDSGRTTCSEHDLMASDGHVRPDDAGRHHHQLRRDPVDRDRPARVVRRLQDHDGLPRRLNRRVEHAVLQPLVLGHHLAGQAGRRLRAGEGGGRAGVAGEGDARIDRLRGEVRVAPGLRLLLEIGAVRGDRRLAVDDLEVAGVRDLWRRGWWRPPEAISFALTVGFLAGGQHEVANAEHLVLGEVRLVECGLDVVGQRRQRPEGEPDRVHVVVRVVRVHRYLADGVVVAPVAAQTGVHTPVAAGLDDRDQLCRESRPSVASDVCWRMRTPSRRSIRRAAGPPGRERRRRSAPRRRRRGAPRVLRHEADEQHRRMSQESEPARHPRSGIAARSTPITNRWIWMSPMPGGG